MAKRNNAKSKVDFALLGGAGLLGVGALIGSNMIGAKLREPMGKYGPMVAAGGVAGVIALQNAIKMPRELKYAGATGAIIALIGSLAKEFNMVAVSENLQLAGDEVTIPINSMQELEMWTDAIQSMGAGRTMAGSYDNPLSLEGDYHNPLAV